MSDSKSITEYSRLCVDGIKAYVLERSTIYDFSNNVSEYPSEKCVQILENMYNQYKICIIETKFDRNCSYMSFNEDIYDLLGIFAYSLPFTRGVYSSSKLHDEIRVNMMILNYFHHRRYLHFMEIRDKLDTICNAPIPLLDIIISYINVNDEYNFK